MCRISELFDLEHTLARDYLAAFSYPWEALEGLGDLILQLGQTLEGYLQPQPGVWLHPTAKIAPTVTITAPCIVGRDTELRHCAYLRGKVLIGDGCVVGNSTELKNAILFDGVQAPHYNYVGDSILGYKAHLGAGAVCSNVRGDKALVTAAGIPTGRKKLGAMVGDFGEVGCHAVLNPGTILGRNARVYPTACVRGVVPAAHIYKDDGSIVRIET